MIKYITSPEGLTADQVRGFFVGWPNPPSPETFLKILGNAAHVVLAVDDESNRVVGFINAISDGMLCAYIPLLEVLPEYQKRGIGAELVRRMIDQLSHLYMVDLACDPDLVPFYQRFGMHEGVAMYRRNFSRQSAV